MRPFVREQRRIPHLLDHFQGKLLFVILLIITIGLKIPFSNGQNIGPINCYRNDGVSLGIEEVSEVRCAPSLPTSPTYCLKANVYDGRTIRDCASTTQCPQGNACAPITYEEDGTTDVVCCCMDDLCNSAKRGNENLWALLTALLMLILIAKYGAQFTL